MAVADLDEAERRLRGRVRLLAQQPRRGNPARHAPDHSRAHPGHALEHATAVDAVIARHVLPWRLSVVTHSDLLVLGPTGLRPLEQPRCTCIPATGAEYSRKSRARPPRRKVITLAAWRLCAR